MFWSNEVQLTSFCHSRTHSLPFIPLFPPPFRSVSSFFQFFASVEKTPHKKKLRVWVVNPGCLRSYPLSLPHRSNKQAARANSCPPPLFTVVTTFVHLHTPHRENVLTSAAINHLAINLCSGVPLYSTGSHIQLQ